jgi:hypothetical protein
MAGGRVATKEDRSSRKGPGRQARTDRSEPRGNAGSRRPSTSRRLLPWLAIGLVVTIVAALVVAKAARHPTSATSTSSVPASVVQAVTGVPVSAFNAAGVPSGLRPPTALPRSTSALTSGGLARVVYIGAEYCPYCAAQRWAMVVALSRFGAFSGLGATESSTNDVFPGTKTFTFYGSTYRSSYLAFTPVELQTNKPAAGGGFTQLQEPTAEEQGLINAFDRPPYTTSPGAIPFIDLGNRFVVIGATFDPAVLRGLSLSQIAGELSDASSEVGRAVLGSANLLTAAICQATGDQPAAVCSSQAVVQAKARLGAAG